MFNHLSCFRPGCQNLFRRTEIRTIYCSDACKIEQQNALSDAGREKMVRSTRRKVDALQEVQEYNGERS